MSCYRPIQAERTLAGEIRLWSRGDGRHLELPCGRCIGCKLDRARAWSIRITHEATLYDSNVFATFTYDQDHAPASLSLEYDDFQSFMKRLRRRVAGVSSAPDGRKPIRFFVAGEYGGQTGRPHFHAILFNTAFRDRKEYVNGTFRSELAEDVWRKGSVVLGSVNSRSAAYVAGYTVKKVYGPRAASHYEDVLDLRTGEVTGRRPEFVVMSRRPGIGAWFFQRYGPDMFPGDVAVQDARTWKVPRYYWDSYREEADPLLVEEIKERRYLKAAENVEESTPERRAVREVVVTRRQASYKERGL